jgi:hypothetical protein
MYISPIITPMSKKENDGFEINEMFMAKADVNRCFFGIIKRGKDNDGNPYVFSRIKMKDGLLCGSASDQKTLGTNLDEMCIHILDKNLHGDAGVSIEIFGGKYFLN